MMLKAVIKAFVLYSGSQTKNVLIFKDISYLLLDLKSLFFLAICDFSLFKKTIRRGRSETIFQKVLWSLDKNDFLVKLSEKLRGSLTLLKSQYHTQYRL